MLPTLQRELNRGREVSVKYSFESRLEKRDEGYVIPIPFNIWEVCRKRDVIQADVKVAGESFECKMFPMEKGSYEIRISDADAGRLKENENYQFLLHVPASLRTMDQNSPYSPEHPIRRIDGIQLIIQPADGLCGQACVAMLAGVTIEDVNKVMDCREWQATMGHVISALNYYGIEHADVIVFTQGREASLPKCCIMMEKMGRFCHYLLHYDGKFYDSNLGILEEYDMSKLLGYFEVKC